MILSAHILKEKQARRVGLFFAGLALLLQILTVPLANRHGLAQSLWEAGAQTIEICSAHGLTSIKIGADGQAAPASAAECAQCIFCLSALLGWLPVSVAKVGASWLQARALLLPAAEHLPASAFRVWSPAHAPPAR